MSGQSFPKKISLSLDVETSGSTPHYDVIGIGGSVMGPDMIELDRFFAPTYFPKQTLFEPRCWDGFWVKHQHVLKVLTYQGPLTKQQCQLDAIVRFQQFRAKWEKYADVDGYEFELICDNPVFDGGFINHLIFTYLPGILPIPYNAGDQKYARFTDTASMLRGFMLARDPTLLSNATWTNLTDKFYEITSIPKPKRYHDHNPANDAYVTAYLQQAIYRASK